MRGQVAARIDFVPHIEGRVLGVAQIFLRVAVVDALGKVFFVVGVRPDALAFFADNRGSARVLTERESSLCGDFRVAQEGQGYALVVVGGFGVFEDCGDFRQVRGAQQERYVAHGVAREQLEGFGRNLENLATLEFGGRNVVFCQQTVFGIVFAEWEHFLVFERRNCHIFVC